MQQQNFDQQDIVSYLHHIFGAQCELQGVTQFKGGTRKQVYFIDLLNPMLRCVLYIWHDLNRYFADREREDSTHSDALAPTMFKVNAEYLQRLGVSIPEIYYMGKLDTGHDFALLEYINGGNFTIFAEDATQEERDSVLTQIDAMLRTINETQRDFPGTILDTATPYPKSCIDMARDNALLELESASATHTAVAEHQTRIAQTLHALHRKLTPRHSFRLIHGELGPEHILIRAGNPKVYFVDIEGVHFFDVEVEHALMKFRFGDEVYTRFFGRNDLDQDRMAFYRFAQHISWFYAGTRFLMGDFYDVAWAERLYTANLARVLQMVESA